MRRTVFSAILCFLSLASAIASSPAAGEDDPNIAAQAPVIHLRQTAVLLSDGQPVVEKNYLYMLHNCQQGKLPLKPLPADVVKKLGRTFYDIWFDGRRMAVRTVYWDFKLPPPSSMKLCQFEPDKWVQISIDRPGQTLEIDMRKMTATRQPSDGVVRAPLRAPTAEDEKEKAEAMAQLKKMGYGSIVESQQSQSSVAGQPCLREVSQIAGTSCTWSGGKQWGFNTDSNFDPAPGSVDEPLGVPDDSVLLELDSGKDGVRLTTQSMTVGGKADEGAFAVPSGLTMKDLN